MSKLKNLKAQRADFLNQAKALNSTENITDEIRNSVSDLTKKIENIDRDIHAEMKIVALESQQSSQNIDPELDKMYDKLNMTQVFMQLASGKKLDGVAAELHNEAVREANQVGIQLGRSNFALPQSFTAKKFKNQQNVGTDSAGGFNVATEVGSIIDYLQAALPFVELGATFFSGLQGNLSFPKDIEGSDVTVTTEVGAATDVEDTFGQIVLSPNRVPAYIEVTEQLMIQSSNSIDAWVNRHLGYKVAKAMHKKVITDLLADSDVNSVSLGTNGAALDWEKVVSFETAIANDNGAESLAWLLNPSLIGKLKTTEKASGYPVYLLGDNNLLNGYNYAKSTLLPNNLTKGDGTGLSAAVLGYWSDLYIAQWGGVQFLVNPFAKDTTGIIRVNAWTFMDSAVAKPGNFAVAKDIITA